MDDISVHGMMNLKTCETQTNKHSTVSRLSKYNTQILGTFTDTSGHLPIGNEYWIFRKVIIICKKCESLKKFYKVGVLC
jgi:hypothetical protein